MRDRFELRAPEAVARCLIRRLIVPRVYFEAKWPDEAGLRADVVVIDREGVGDAHVVEIKRTAAGAIAAIPALMRMRAPYRWIAFEAGSEDQESSSALISENFLYPATRAGKVGVVEVVTMTGGTLGANIRIQAERFPGRYYELAESFAGSHEADIEYR